MLRRDEQGIVQAMRISAEKTAGSYVHLIA
jgi:hypothetical protein